MKSQGGNFLIAWACLWAVPTTLVLSGCAAVSPASRIGEVSAPGAWAATREAKAGIDRYWVRKIGGTELGGLVEQAIGYNLDLEAAAARVERAGAEAKIAGAERLPSLGLGLDGRRSKQNFIGFPFGNGGGGAPSIISNQFGVSLNAAWEVDVWGRAKAGQEAAIADAEARAYEYRAAQVSLAGQVAKAWLALAEANAQVALAEEGLAARRSLAAAVRERFERAIFDDGGSAAQVRLTEAEAANGAAILAQRQQERQRVLRQLELLMGRYPSGKLAVSASLPPFPGSTPAGLPSELLLRRPDILAAERELAASGKRVTERKLARFPSLSLTGSAGTTTESIRDILKSDFGVWAIGGSLTQPIFEGGRITGQIARAQAIEREEIAQLRKTVLDAFGEVEQALAAEIFLAERERAAERAAELAGEAATRAAQEFSGGTGDVLTLIEAKTQQIETASQYAAIRRLRLENRVDLHLALGGDFTLGK